ncbi:MAG TPA: hypothetical protein VFY90_14050, partial [Tepidiformaceae bacterium]|nr:hypothetical protein [Tepidiformaceae bacterium]
MKTALTGGGMAQDHPFERQTFVNPQRKLSTLGAAASAAVLATVAVSAAGSNLVKNGDFAQGTSHWAPSYANETILQPGPNGTGEFINASHVATDYNLSATQCINLSGGIYEMFLAGDIQIPSGQLRSGKAALWAWPFPEDDCKGSSDHSRGAPDVSAVGAWQHVDSSFIPPQWTRSIRVELRNHMAPAGPGEDPSGEFTVLFDNVSLTNGDVMHYPLPEADVPDAPDVPNLPDGPFDVPIPGPLGEPPVQTPPVQEPPVQDPPVQTPPVQDPPVVQPPVVQPP